MALPLIQGESQDLFIDKEGNRYICGSFTGTRDFDPTTNVDIHIAGSDRDGFVTRLNADGTYGWTRAVGAAREVRLRAVCVLGETVYALGAEVQGHAFLAALDRNSGEPREGFGARGVAMFARGAEEYVSAVAAAGGTVYAAMTCNNILGTIGKQTETYSLVLAVDGKTGAPKAGFGQAGVQTVGNAQPAIDLSKPSEWAAAFRSTQAAGLTICGGCVYLAGYFDGGVPGIGMRGRMASNGDSDVYVAAIDLNTGQPKAGFGNDGVQTFGGRLGDYPCDITSRDGTIFVTGTCTGQGLTIGPDAEVCPRSRMFIIALDATTGKGMAEFGDRGILTFPMEEWAGSRGICAAGDTIFVMGEASKPCDHDMFAGVRQANRLSPWRFGVDGILTIHVPCSGGGGYVPQQDRLCRDHRMVDPEGTTTKSAWGVVL